MYNAKAHGFILKAGTAFDATSTATTLSFQATQSVMVKRLCFQVKTTFNSSVSAVITFAKRPTPGSSSGAVTLGTVSVPTAAAAPSVYYKDISGTAFRPGDELLVSCSTASTSAGDGYAFIAEVEEVPEVVANLSNHIASA